MFVNSETGRLKIREANSQRMFTVYGINATLDSEETAATQLNKLFNVALIQVVGDTQTTFTIEKVVAQGGN